MNSIRPDLNYEHELSLLAMNRYASMFPGSQDNEFDIKPKAFSSELHQLKQRTISIDNNHFESSPLRHKKSVVTFQERPDYLLNTNAQKILRKIDTTEKKNEAEEDNYVKIVILHGNSKESTTFFDEYQQTARSLLASIELRNKYLFKEHVNYTGINDLIYYNPNSKEPRINYLLKEKICLLPPLENFSLMNESGVCVPYENSNPIGEYMKMDEFFFDLHALLEETHSSPNKTYCYRRLEVLEQKFKMHHLFNEEKEIMQQKIKAHRDFYNVRKIDTHIHHSACMNVKKFLRFIRDKVEQEGNTEVLLDKKANKPMTLKQLFERMDLKASDLNVDSLDVQADANTFQRFDRFNKKYNPLGQTELREIFLKTENYIDGRYIAEITLDVMKNLNENKYEFAEWRISIYGRSMKEWGNLAGWISKYKIFVHNVRWLIQIPRLYEVYKKNKMLENFGQMIDNIFKPIFEVTIDPSKDPNLYYFLLQVVGFDTVDDESVYEKAYQPSYFMTPPEEWIYTENPPYCYWIYYLYANIYTLNLLRKKRGLNTFSFRPHGGEAGNMDHLIGAYLLADGINHGIRLTKSPVLEYLYYLTQIGIAVSPLSNNKLFVEYNKNPFPRFFARGLNVSLSTDDPLIIHMTNEALLEEYAVAAQVWNLSSCDLCEIAKNSVIQSGFEEILKKHWLGEKYKQRTKDANDITKTNVPMTRHVYRLETLDEEMKELKLLAEIQHEKLEFPELEKLAKFFA